MVSFHLSICCPDIFMEAVRLHARCLLLVMDKPFHGCTQVTVDRPFSGDAEFSAALARALEHYLHEDKRLSGLPANSAFLRE